MLEDQVRSLPVRTPPGGGSLPGGEYCQPAEALLQAIEAGGVLLGAVLPRTLALLVGRAP